MAKKLHATNNAPLIGGAVVVGVEVKSGLSDGCFGRGDCTAVTATGRLVTKVAAMLLQLEPLQSPKFSIPQ